MPPYPKTFAKDLRRALGPTSTTAQRVSALKSIGFTLVVLAKTLRITPQTLREWESGQVQPREAAAANLDNVRFAALVLLEHGTAPEEIQPWFVSRRGVVDGFDPSPAALIADDPERVLAAAQAHASGDEDTATSLILDAAVRLSKARGETPAPEEETVGAGV